MDTRKITIRVDAEAAKAYAAASVEEREKIDLLLSMRLSQVAELRHHWSRSCGRPPKRHVSAV